MIKEAYCSYEVSKLLKEKGFDAPCSKAYMNDSMVTKASAQLIDFNSNGYVSKPTHQMAMDWLREVHNLHIAIVVDVNDKHCFYGEIYYNGEECWYEQDYYPDGVDTFEEAVEDALKYCLTNLI